MHVGSAIGTIMAANVFFVIIPGQQRMVNAMRAGLTPGPMDGVRGKQRSVHNNYFTLPVIFIMISNHYASTYGHKQAWAVLMLVTAAACIRHFFNRKHKGVFAWQYLVIGTFVLAAVAWWTVPRLAPLPKVEGPVTFRSGSRHRGAALHRLPFAFSHFLGNYPAPRRRVAALTGCLGQKYPKNLSAGGCHKNYTAWQRHANDGLRARGCRCLDRGRR